MYSLLSDLHHTARRLRQAPLFTGCAVAVLAIGIGLNAVVFDLVDTALFRPLPFTDAGRIVRIYQDSDDGLPSSTSFPAYRDMAAMTEVFAGVAATSPETATWEEAAERREVAVQYVTASYLPVLGLRPYVGRWFGPEHDRLGAEMTAVVSYSTWRTQMGADRDVVGRTVRLNNQPVTIVGVGPKAFNGEANTLVTDFWLSISSTPVGGPYRALNLERRQDHWYQVLARLAPGVTVEQARGAMDALAVRLADAYPDIDARRGIRVFPLDAVRFHPLLDRPLLGGSLVAILIAASILLLACSNLANLLLARGVSRSAELAVRQALGADRLRIARLLLLEALLLSAVGGVAGLALAAWTARLLSAVFLPSVPGVPGGHLDLGFDHRVALFGALTAMTTALLFGLLPALRSARTDVAGSLREAERRQSAGRGLSLLRKGLVCVQVAISLVLMVGAGLLGRSLANAERVDPGVDAERIAVIATNLQQGGVEQGQIPAVIDALLKRVAALPGVERAALTTRLPVQSGFSNTMIVDGYTPPAGTGSVELPVALVSRGYFQTMGIPVLAGRTFDAGDRGNSRPVIVVNEAAARAFWGGDAVGRRLRSQGTDTAWQEVVGVVADAKVGSLTEAPTPMIYRSVEQAPAPAFSIVARTAGAPAALMAPLRKALRDVRASLPVTRQLPLETHFENALAANKASSLLMGGFSMLALLLASLGIYAVVSFTVERRTQELGIRVALGATRAGIIRMVLRESLSPVSLGLAAGLMLAVLGGRALEGLLFGVAPADPLTFAGSAALLVATACVAAFLPARRAASANPVEVLRRE